MFYAPNSAHGRAVKTVKNVTKKVAHLTSIMPKVQNNVNYETILQLFFVWK